ncbi:NifB/NifX family molybdenum-iron cluster-binding protein [Treponema bryantii]|uniref:NifB/NifX family molybdenum-iron cluster-binding protein n=1 Tax=Treponema bryantii TaxID=163 RepID=UPI0003B62C24|nr:NifB/NifX family molybdenum-iron cluster-binding protein [Treponema bryantii]
MADKASISSIYKVAIASTDGETVNQHYGKAEKFYIYSIDDQVGYDLEEERHVQPVCMDGAHEISRMKKSVLNFTDCRYIVVSRLGAAASATLAAAGITAMELPGSIDDAILRVWKYNQIQNLFN